MVTKKTPSPKQLAARKVFTEKSKAGTLPKRPSKPKIGEKYKYRNAVWTVEDTFSDSSMLTSGKLVSWVDNKIIHTKYVKV